LNVATAIKKGSILLDIKPDYENEYVKVQWFKSGKKFEIIKTVYI